MGEQSLQGRGAFRAKFAMENENGLPGSFSADGWFRFERVGAQEKFFNSSSGIDVEGTGDVPTVVFVIEPTVDNMV
jgi:hypothetical protein